MNNDIDIEELKRLHAAATSGQQLGSALLFAREMYNAFPALIALLEMMQWRPISEAPKDAREWIVGKYNKSGKWTWKPTSYLEIAVEDGYTHYFLVPPPPEAVR